MAVKLSLQGLEPVPVDFYGTEFAAVAATKPVAEKIEDAWQVVSQADGRDAEVAALGAVFDLRLTPQGESKKKASAVIKELWDAGKLTIPQILDDLGRISDAADRPTPQQ